MSVLKDKASLQRSIGLLRSFLSITLGLAATSALAQVQIDTVLVGDAGNPGDSLADGAGAVAYEYYIGTYEVTNSQYVAFLNSVAATDPHGLYNNAAAYTGITRSGTSGSYTYAPVAGRENRPVNNVSFWDAARFANWLTTGDTETGVYNLGGVTNPVNATITRDATAWANGGVAIASRDEWHKAAYYSGSPTGADGDGYWWFPTQSSTPPVTTAQANIPPALSDFTDVGSYAAHGSHYGTFDQAGNAGEWTDLISGGADDYRVFRGGDFLSSTDGWGTESSWYNVNFPDSTNVAIGFRVTSLSTFNLTAVPEPSTYAALVGVLALGFAAARRRRCHDR